MPQGEMRTALPVHKFIQRLNHFFLGNDTPVHSSVIQNLNSKDHEHKKNCNNIKQFVQEMNVD